MVKLVKENPDINKIIVFINIKIKNNKKIKTLIIQEDNKKKYSTKSVKAVLKDINFDLRRSSFYVK